MPLKRISTSLIFNTLVVYAAEKDRFNWIETFTLVNGMHVIDTPGYVQMDFIQLPKVTV